MTAQFLIGILNPGQMKLKFSAPVVVLDSDANDTPIHDLARLAKLDGVASEECFSDYLVDDLSLKQLPARGVSGGYLCFRFKTNGDKLWVETEYDLKESLTEQEVSSLREYTSGQWSDGIGENFCPECYDRFGMYPAIQFDTHFIVTHRV